MLTDTKKELGLKIGLKNRFKKWIPENCPSSLCKAYISRASFISTNKILTTTAEFSLKVFLLKCVENRSHKSYSHPPNKFVLFNSLKPFKNGQKRFLFHLKRYFRFKIYHVSKLGRKTSSIPLFIV